MSDRPRGSLLLTRWVVPGAGLTLALTGTVLLLGSEMAMDPDFAPVASGSSGGAVSQPAADRDAGPRLGFTPPGDSNAAGAADAADAADPAAAQPSRAPLRDLGPRRPAFQPQSGRPRVLETPETQRAQRYINELARLQTLQERLDKLDEWVATLPEQTAIDAIAGLLDSELPGDFYESENLRLGVMGRLNALRDPKANTVLVARLDPELPRPQRLLAIEMLAARDNAGRSEITGIAQQDHDAVVQAKAKWAVALWQ
ncbi:hypothetical protein OAX78_03850 [Planctomycetota bacterium]|nr:hypothetical protein [Planctomycetota bacterium]